MSHAILDSRPSTLTATNARYADRRSGQGSRVWDKEKKISTGKYLWIHPIHRPVEPSCDGRARMEINEVRKGAHMQRRRSTTNPSVCTLQVQQVVPCVC